MSKFFADPKKNFYSKIMQDILEELIIIYIQFFFSKHIVKNNNP